MGLMESLKEQINVISLQIHKLIYFKQPSEYYFLMESFVSFLFSVLTFFYVNNSLLKGAVKETTNIRFYST